jgi:hypothetical protein
MVVTIVPRCSRGGAARPSIEDPDGGRDCRGCWRQAGGGRRPGDQLRLRVVDLYLRDVSFQACSGGHWHMHRGYWRSAEDLRVYCSGTVRHRDCPRWLLRSGTSQHGPPDRMPVDLCVPRSGGMASGFGRHFVLSQTSFRFPGPGHVLPDRGIVGGGRRIRASTGARLIQLDKFRRCAVYVMIAPVFTRLDRTKVMAGAGTSLKR